MTKNLYEIEKIFMKLKFFNKIAEFQTKLEENHKNYEKYLNKRNLIKKNP